MSQMLNLEGSGMLPPDDILVADVQQSESLPFVLFLVIVLTRRLSQSLPTPTFSP
jgi:hypothetical protein